MSFGNILVLIGIQTTVYLGYRSCVCPPADHVPDVLQLLDRDEVCLVHDQQVGHTHLGKEMDTWQVQGGSQVEVMPWPFDLFK